MSEIVPPPLPTASAAGDGLQFGRAEFEGSPALATCTTCQKAIERHYFEVNGAVVCGLCRTALAIAEKRGTPAGRFFRALGAGSLAGAAGSLLYFLIAELTGYEFGLVAILVGFAVGAAVKWGSHGRGGRFYQALAVAITYLAIVTTYVPQILDAFAANGTDPVAEVQAAEHDAAAADVTDAETTIPDAAAVVSTTPPPAGEPPVQQATLGMFLVAWLFILVVACAAPFLAGVQNLMGILIIGFGLWEAWKINRREAVTITGPHALTGAPPAAAASAQ